MDLSNKKIIIGGWPVFAEAIGVNKKEPVENFGWMPSESDKMAYEDLRAALDKVEGSREWLKNYTKKNDEYLFHDEIGSKVSKAVTSDHSAASFTGLMWCYKRALNDWDNFVFKAKEYQGLREFKAQQVPLWKIRNILSDCNEWLAAQGRDDTEKVDALKTKIITDCASLCITGMHVLEIRLNLLELQDDLEEINYQEEMKKAEDRHLDLMGSIEFLYKNPIRWFDTPSGCSLNPCHPTHITKRAMTEMEGKFPGYKKHIENVLLAMESPRKPAYNNGTGGIFSKAGYHVWDNFLREEDVMI